MKKRLVFALFASTCIVTASGAWVHPSMAADAAVPVVADGIGGVVTGDKGPEAGVWVIAVTNDLPTRFIKIVVTDDQGRFMLPELPKAKYKVWVRGYGLVDSKQVDGVPGKNLNLKSVQAPDAKAAAQYYPANYWYSLIKPPAESEFPGTGPQGNGIAPVMTSQQVWVSQMKDGCGFCHQQGDKATRELVDNTAEGWGDRIKKARADGDHVLGNHGKDFAAQMQNTMARYGRGRALAMWSDWTQRIAKGELPHETPPRPAGAERNLVLTEWDWANGRYVHDEVSSDRHDPSVNPNGLVYGVIAFGGYIETIDPKTGKQDEISYKVNINKDAEFMPKGTTAEQFPHNPMLDSKGRLWVTDLGHHEPPPPDAAKRQNYCADPTTGKYAKYWPQPGVARTTIVVYDGKNKTIQGIPACNGLHHLQFGPDQKTLYFSGDTDVVSWVDTKVWDDTHDAAKSVGWCPMVLDTKERGVTKVALGDNGVVINPDRTQWNEPASTGRPGGMTEEEAAAQGKAAARQLDPKKDTRISGFLYGIDSNIKDGSMWFAKTAPFPTGIVRFERGSNPPETCHTEFYEPPLLPDGKNYAAFDGRAVSVDSNGIVWVAYGSGELGRFDRSKCKVMNGPTATGQHCPEGWSFFNSPGPKMQGVKVGSADFHYYDWVDLHDTLGLGKDTPILTGAESDSLLAFDQKTEKFNVLRVPYPIGFHSRGMDGRFDDPSKGWKGKALFATFASEPVWHQEDGDDASGPELVKFQIRPDPLAH